MKNSNMKPINTIKELKEEAVKGADFYILLKHGLVSRKTIRYDKKKKIFTVYNHIDDTKQKLTEKELLLLRYTNIGRAIRKGAFVKLEE